MAILVDLFFIPGFDEFREIRLNNFKNHENLIVSELVANQSIDVWVIMDFLDSLYFALRILHLFLFLFRI